MRGILKYTVLSRVMSGDKLLGFTVVSDSSAIKVTLDNIIRAGGAVQYTNAEYDEVYKTLVGTQGSLTDYPIVNENNVLLGKDGLVISHIVVNSITGKADGVICYTSRGVCNRVTFKRLNDLCREYKACNFNIVNTKEGIGVESKNPNKPFGVVEYTPTNAVSSNVYNSSKGEKPAFEVELNSINMPCITINQLDDRDVEIPKVVKDKMLNGDRKMVSALLNLSILTPYYYVLLQSIRKRPVNGLGTMGVSEDTLFYDLLFIDSLSIAELSFVLIHETLHIAMQHSLRFGKRKRHDLWNIATDLYINSIICNDFGIHFGDAEKEFNIRVDDKDKVAYLKTPNFGVYIETVGGTLDLARECPETIYEKLCEWNDDSTSMMSMSGASGESGQGSDGSQGQGGQGGQSGQNSQDGQSNQSQDSSNGQGDSEGNSGSLSGSKIQNNGQGGEDNLNQDGNKEYQGMQDVSVIYNGKRLSGKILTDVMTTTKGDPENNIEERISKSKSALQRMKTKMQMAKEEGQILEKNAGAGGALTQRYIEFGLSANIRWEDVLRNIVKCKPKKTFTLAHPNEAYMNLGMTLASRRAIGRPESIDKIKIAIDVSGSVSQNELNRYLSEVNNIFTKFKVTGELIYWSTSIGAVGDFHDTKGLCKVNPKTTGGTDVKCVFDYLSGKTKVNGAKEQDRVRDIPAVCIITDGCFSKNYEEYEEMFGRKTLWLISGNVVGFEPLFGKVFEL